jgi:hypothetical protein
VNTDWSCVPQLTVSFPVGELPQPASAYQLVCTSCVTFADDLLTMIMLSVGFRKAARDDALLLPPGVAEVTSGGVVYEMTPRDPVTTLGG